MVLILLSLFLTISDYSVTIPDSVQTGTVFSCEISLTGDDLTSLNCVPVFSDGLQYMGTSSMNSFSSVSTPAGRSVSSEVRLLMSFRAPSSGTYTIGPLILTSSGRIVHEFPVLTVTAIGSIPGTASPGSPRETGTDEIAWMEIEIDTTGRVYPGQTFNVDYFIFKARRNAEIVDLFLEPSNYASSNLLENFEELQWVRCKDGIYKTWLATLEVTPAFSCTLSLPVLRGRIGLPGGMIRPASEYYISTEGERIPVYPFPQMNRPENFDGITAEISFGIERVTRGYSAAGERCIQLSIRGPGYSQLNEPPELTVEGPAELFPGRSFTLSHETNAWYILVEPSDSGRVIIGPDSVAWFDTDREQYRQAVIPACTVSVYPIGSMPVDISSLRNSDSDSSLLWITIVFLLLTLFTIILLHNRKRIAGYATAISDVNDIEELLTAFGDRLSEMLTGSISYMGSQELDEALDENIIDPLISRGLLRHWKDLELILSERTVKAEHLERLKKKTLELVRELEAELEK